MNMRAERSSVSDVKAKLAKLAAAVEEKNAGSENEDILVKMENARLDEERKKMEKKKKRHQRVKGQ